MLPTHLTFKRFRVGMMYRFFVLGWIFDHNWAIFLYPIWAVVSLKFGLLGKISEFNREQLFNICLKEPSKRLIRLLYQKCQSSIIKLKLEIFLWHKPVASGYVIYISCTHSTSLRCDLRKDLSAEVNINAWKRDCVLSVFDFLLRLDVL